MIAVPVPPSGGETTFRRLVGKRNGVEPSTNGGQQQRRLGKGPVLGKPLAREDGLWIVPIGG